MDWKVDSLRSGWQWQWRCLKLGIIGTINANNRSYITWYNAWLLKDNTYIIRQIDDRTVRQYLQRDSSKLNVSHELLKNNIQCHIMSVRKTSFDEKVKCCCNISVLRIISVLRQELSIIIIRTVLCSLDKYFQTAFFRNLSVAYPVQNLLKKQCYIQRYRPAQPINQNLL